MKLWSILEYSYLQNLAFQSCCTWKFCSCTFRPLLVHKLPLSLDPKLGPFSRPKLSPKWTTFSCCECWFWLKHCNSQKEALPNYGQLLCKCQNVNNRRLAHKESSKIWLPFWKFRANSQVKIAKNLTCSYHLLKILDMLWLTRYLFCFPLIYLSLTILWNSLQNCQMFHSWPIYSPSSVHFLVLMGRSSLVIIQLRHKWNTEVSYLFYQYNNKITQKVKHK